MYETLCEIVNQTYLFSSKFTVPLLIAQHQKLSLFLGVDGQYYQEKHIVHIFLYI